MGRYKKLPSSAGERPLEDRNGNHDDFEFTAITIPTSEQMKENMLMGLRASSKLLAKDKEKKKKPELPAIDTYRKIRAARKCRYQGSYKERKSDKKGCNVAETEETEQVIDYSESKLKFYKMLGIIVKHPQPAC